MPNYYSPGVYIEEVNTGPRPIEAVATAVAAFVGFAPYSNHDDANQPVLITSWAQYVEKFGLRKDDGRKEPFAKDAYMPHAVYGYFLNGGTRCYVVRVVSPAWQKALKDKQLTAEPQQVLTRQARAARRPGEEIKPEDVVLTITPKAASLRDIEVSIDRAAGSQPADCAIAVRVKMGDTVEEYKRIQLITPLEEAALAARQKAEEAAYAAEIASQTAAAANQAETEAAKKANEAVAASQQAADDATADKVKQAADAAEQAEQAYRTAQQVVDGLRSTAFDGSLSVKDRAAAAKKADEAAVAAEEAKQAAANKASEAAAAANKAEEAVVAAQEAKQAVAVAQLASQAATAAKQTAQAYAAAATQAATAAQEAAKTAAAEKLAVGAGDFTSAPQAKETLAYLNRKSNLVTIERSATLAETDLAFGVYYLSVPQPGANAKQLAGAGQNGLASLAQIQQRDIVGDATERTGVFGLEIAPDVTMVCCPDLFSPQAYPDGKVDIAQVKTVQTAMINHCELAADRVAILDAPDDFNPQKIASWRINSDGSGAGYDSMFAALYYPWITVANPLAGDAGEPKQINIPPCGHIAGIYARNDSERGVHKAPANEIVRGALSVTREITRGEQDGLNPNGINCIRTFPGRGIRVWGARTLTSDPLWRYVSVRRLFNMVEKSIERDTQWVVFEPNTPDLWSRVRRDVNAFLMTLWRDGMLFGTTPDQAFYVKCDAELNPPESRDLGRLIIEVGLAPVKPAEFVIFRFSQFTAEAS